MGLHDEDINMAELEFVSMFDNHMGGGLQSVWRNKGGISKNIPVLGGWGDDAIGVKREDQKGY